MATVCFKLAIVPKTPFHIGTGYGLAGVCDSATVRGSDKLAYIPGSTLKGRIKYYYRMIAELVAPPVCTDDSPCSVGRSCVVCSLFGSPLRAGGVIFGNAVLSDNFKDTILEGDTKKNTPRKRAFSRYIEKQIRTSVMINRNRRVAEPKKLFNMETINPEMKYGATIAGDFDPTQWIGNVPIEAALLAAAIKSVDAFGGRKSRGLGRCKFISEEIYINSSKIGTSTLIAALGR